jgi:hypothetical protein
LPVKGNTVEKNVAYTKADLQAFAQNHPEQLEEVLHGGTFIRGADVFI